MKIVFSAGFRPFFLAAGAWAVLALLIWIALLATGAALPSRFDPMTWHIHEMLFGFGMAAVGGFLFTAIPNWTGRPALAGIPVATALWLAGRAACLVSALMPAWLAIALDLAFPAYLAAIAAHKILGARNWKNLPMMAPVTVLAAADLLMHLQESGFGWRLGLAAMTLLISVIGGRIIPSFTRNWLVAQGETDLPSTSRIIDRLALGTLHPGLFAWVVLPDSPWAGGLLLLGAAANAVRLAGWRGMATGSEPLLLILHIGYGWVVLGAALLGLSLLGAPVPFAAAIHALTAGAMGTMILAVMTRASRGHTGRALTADRKTRLLYACVLAAAAVRVAAAFGFGATMPLLILSAGLWSAAFLLFLLAYGPFLLSPRL